LQIQSYLFANKTGQGVPASLAEQRAWFDVMVEKYAGHPIPLPEGTRVESVNVGGMPFMKQRTMY
jgi:epsilon-lactone hydrolase